MLQRCLRWQNDPGRRRFAIHAIRRFLRHSFASTSSGRVAIPSDAISTARRNLENLRASLLHQPLHSVLAPHDVHLLRNTVASVDKAVRMLHEQEEKEEKEDVKRNSGSVQAVDDGQAWTANLLYDLYNQQGTHVLNAQPHLPQLRALGSLQFDNAQMRTCKVSPFFHETVERMLVTMSMDSRQARRHLAETIMMEALLFLQPTPSQNLDPRNSSSSPSQNLDPRKSSTSPSQNLDPRKSSTSAEPDGKETKLESTEGSDANVGNDTIASTTADILPNLLCGIHADYTFRIDPHDAQSFQSQAPARASSCRNTSGNHGKSKAVTPVSKDSLYGTIDYLLTPHFRQNEFKNQHQDYLQRSVCMVLFAEPTEHLPARLESMLPVVQAWVYAQYLRIQHDQLLTTLGDSSFSQQQQRILIHPLNVIITDGLRWHFSRAYPFPDQLLAKTTTALHESAMNTWMIRECFAIPDHPIASSEEEDRKKNDVRLLRHVVLDPKRGGPSMDLYSSGVLNLNLDHGNAIFGILRYWLRGLVPDQRPGIFSLQKTSTKDG